MKKSKELKRREAAERLAKRAAKSIRQRITDLELRPGFSRREYTRLMRLLNEGAADGQ